MLIQQKSKFLNIGGQQTHFDIFSVKKHLTLDQIIELPLALQSVKTKCRDNCKSTSSEDDYQSYSMYLLCKPGSLVFVLLFQRLSSLIKCNFSASLSLCSSPSPVPNVFFHACYFRSLTFAPFILGRFFCHPLCSSNDFQMCLLLASLSPFLPFPVIPDPFTLLLPVQHNAQTACSPICHCHCYVHVSVHSHFLLTRNDLSCSYILVKQEQNKREI